MTIATINRFIQLFADAFRALPAAVPMQDIERLAMFVHGAMENKHRAYHTSSHVFFMCRSMGPRQVLAALFHDVVYYQLDGGFPKQATPLLEPVVRNEHGKLVLNPLAPDDTALQLCADIFEFQSGQILPLFGGMNEFLSAVVAIRLLEPYVAMRDLIAIAGCIAATVPFCGPDTQGRSYAHVLADRIRGQCQKLLPTLPAEDIERHVVQAMREAIKIANRDVAGFAESNPGKFLSATWQLIEESNAPLADIRVYTLQDYRNALARMEKFLAGLNPDYIFRQYDDYPDNATLSKLNVAARKNLAFSLDYLGAKLTSVAIVESLALETGGNCPVSMFLGDIRSPFGKPDRIEDFLPSTPPAPDIQPQLLQVLEQGRAQASSTDLNASPLTAFIYRTIGHEGIQRATQQSKRLFAGELSALGFLQSLDQAMIRTIVVACANIAISRRETLLQLHGKLA